MNDSELEAKLSKFAPADPSRELEERIAFALRVSMAPASLPKSPAPIAGVLSRPKESIWVRLFYGLGWAGAGAGAAVITITCLHPTAGAIGRPAGMGAKAETAPETTIAELPPAVAINTVETTVTPTATAEMPAAIPAATNPAATNPAAANTGRARRARNRASRIARAEAPLFEPADSDREIVSAENAIVYDANNEPTQLVLYSSIERHAWTDAATGAWIEVEAPREDMELVPVDFQ